MTDVDDRAAGRILAVLARIEDRLDRDGVVRGVALDHLEKLSAPLRLANRRSTQRKHRLSIGRAAGTGRVRDPNLRKRRRIWHAGHWIDA